VYTYIKVLVNAHLVYKRKIISYFDGENREQRKKRAGVSSDTTPRMGYQISAFNNTVPRYVAWY
jgi:hypothetical protein